MSARAIAEYAVAAAMLVARGLDEATRQKRDGRFTRSGYQVRTVAGSTMGVVGLGGIGREVGRMAQALGMRVVATRWSTVTPEHDVDGADIVLPAERLLEVAAESDSTPPGAVAAPADPAHPAPVGDGDRSGVAGRRFRIVSPARRSGAPRGDVW